MELGLELKMPPGFIRLSCRVKRPTNKRRTVSIISDQVLVRIPRRAYLFHWRLLDILCYLCRACPASAASSKNMK